MTAMSISPVASASDLQSIGAYVESRSAILCPPDKHYLFEARLRPVIREHKLSGMSELAHKLRLGSNPALGEAVVEAMTTNETSWFRDIHPFDAMREGVLPDLIAKRAATRKLSVWSAACSSGQELYSLGMMMDLHFPQLSSWDVRLLGTDISTEVLDHARTARYSALEVNRGLPAQYLTRYMARDGAGYVVSDTIRKRASFEKLNFIAPWPPLPRFDLVMCRNVLIYFDVAVRARIVQKIRDSLAPDGYLILGSSETSLGNVDGFTRTVFGRTTVYRKDQR